LRMTLSHARSDDHLPIDEEIWPSGEWVDV